MKILLIAAGVVVMLVSAPGAAFAATNPSGTGQPSAECLEEGATAEPGLSPSAPGSAFNEDPGGVAGSVYAGNGVTTTTPANAAAVSQYDVACYQVTQNH
jgi:hypothetical protein